MPRRKGRFFFFFCLLHWGVDAPFTHVMRSVNKMSSPSSVRARTCVCACARARERERARERGGIKLLRIFKCLQIIVCMSLCGVYKQLNIFLQWLLETECPFLSSYKNICSYSPAADGDIVSHAVLCGHAGRLYHHGVISSNQIRSARQASNQCGQLFSQEFMYQLQFFRKDFKPKPWTWTHKEPSFFIYFFTFLRLILDASLRRHVSLSRDQQSCSAREDWRWVSLTQSEKAKLFSLPNNIVANLWRRWLCRFARVWWPDCF